MAAIETPSDDAAEQSQPLEQVGADPDALNPEAPEADAVEQRRLLRDPDAPSLPAGPDADPERAYDEERPVDLDEDDYR